MLRASRPVLLALASLLVTLALVEAVLQLAAIWRPDRGGPWRADARVRILCIGDSHTWGAGVERQQSYPGQLQQLLDAAEPGAYSVLNLGVPGMNTSQLRNRVPEWLRLLQPDVLIVWGGVNNEWNLAEVPGGGDGLLGRLDRALLHSRLYRLVRVRLHDRELEAVAAEAGAAARPLPLEHERHERDLARIEPQAVDDLSEIARLAQSRGIRVAFVTYPVNAGSFERANMAAWRVAEEFGLPLIPGWESLARVPVAERKWLWAMHPGAEIYQQFARDISRWVLDPDSVGPPERAAEEFRDDTRIEFELTLRAAILVATAAPPLDAREREQLQQLQGFLGTDYDLDRLPALDPEELRSLNTDLLPVLKRVAGADGAVDDRERAVIDEVARLMPSATAR